MHFQVKNTFESNLHHNTKHTIRRWLTLSTEGTITSNHLDKPEDQNELSDFVPRELTMKNGVMVSKDDNHVSS